MASGKWLPFCLSLNELIGIYFILGVWFHSKHIYQWYNKADSPEILFDDVVVGFLQEVRLEFLYMYMTYSQKMNISGPPSVDQVTTME